MADGLFAPPSGLCPKHPHAVEAAIHCGLQGLWGGVQPGLYRVDAGPRLSMNVGRGIRLHADYRQRLAGEAAPSSGPALTIAGDF